MTLPQRSPYSHHARRKPLLLDLYCKVGGAGMGYWLAGFEVVGVDIEPQPNYPFKFIQADALRALRSPRLMRRVRAVHASPPCQLFTGAASIGRSRDSLQRAAYDARHHDLIGPTRKLLKKSGLPYVIENVPGAPLRRPITLCGSMFGLQVKRHRLFESNLSLVQPDCNHKVWVRRFHAQAGTSRTPAQVNPTFQGSRVVGVYGNGTVTNGEFNGTDLWRWAMQIPWARNRKELAQAIPPPYTEFIGWQLMDYLYGPER